MRLDPEKLERISPYGQRVRPPQRCFKREKFWFLAVDPEAASGHKGRPSERSAAWLAHQSGGLGVGGSNPLAPTISRLLIFPWECRDLACNVGLTGRHLFAGSR